MTAVPRHILAVIVFSQFAGTSLWFAVNAVMPDLQRAWGLPPEAVGTLTSAVQLGFIAGTLTCTLTMLSDRFSPSRVFFACAVLGASANALTVLLDGHWPALVSLRFCVGFFLAGVYPVGMKIVASWYRERLGMVMGVLIGAFVAGTALPYGLRAVDFTVGSTLSWQAVVLGVSFVAALGGLATALLVPDRPQSTHSMPLRLRALTVIWHDRGVRASVFGYFGHMWELYAFYVLAPFIVVTRLAEEQVSAAVFWIIVSGAAGCVGGGLLTQHFRSSRVAATQLAISGTCCLAAPLMLGAPLPLFLAWMVLWGITVAGDSPQFSTLIAQNAPVEIAGSVLTFSNCIGFSITVASIQIFVHAAQSVPLATLLPWLAIGPVVGLIMFRPLWR